MTEGGSNYQAGVCNMTPHQTKFRFELGVAMLVLTLTTLTSLIIFDLPPLFSLMIFIPAFLSAISFLEANGKFCFTYAVTSRFGTGNGYRDTDRVLDPAQRIKDRFKAMQLFMQAVVIAIGAVVIAFFLVP